MMDVREKTSNKKRLIDANELKKKMCYKCNDEYSDEPCEPDDCVFCNAINDAQTIDAVSVVRCRECFYYTPVDKNTGKCAFLIGAHQYAVPDGYCYLGERKEGAD